MTTISFSDQKFISNSLDLNSRHHHLLCHHFHLCFELLDIESGIRIFQSVFPPYSPQLGNFSLKYFSTTLHSVLLINLTIFIFSFPLLSSKFSIACGFQMNNAYDSPAQAHFALIYSSPFTFFLIPFFFYLTLLFSSLRCLMDSFLWDTVTPANVNGITSDK